MNCNLNPYCLGPAYPQVYLRNTFKGATQSPEHIQGCDHSHEGRDYKLRRGETLHHGVLATYQVVEVGEKRRGDIKVAVGLPECSLRLQSCFESLQRVT